MHEDRCIGSLLGCAAGDVLGTNLEFLSREQIQRRYGRVENFLDSDERPLGEFTDDTAMTLALAASLIECGRLDAGHCAATYARFFASEPRRGYGPPVSKILAMLEAGSDYRDTGRAIYSGGSFANGGAMRIAPVGLAFRNATDVVLREAVRLALLRTHVHPAAVLRTKLGIVLQRHNQYWRDEELLSALCTPNEYGAQFQIHAAEAVACALWAFVCCPADPKESNIRADCFGGDTDTVGTMTGALAGALHGSSWIPCHWFNQIENMLEVGRDYMIGLARQLAKLDLRQVVE